MTRTRSVVSSLLALVLVPLSLVLGAQTPAQNDSAVKAAAKTNSLPLIGV